MSCSSSGCACEVEVEVGGKFIKESPVTLLVRHKIDLTCDA